MIYNLVVTFRKMLIKGRLALQVITMMERFMSKGMVQELLKRSVLMIISHIKVKTPVSCQQYFLTKVFAPFHEFLIDFLSI